MYFMALATDYDGTVAHDGSVSKKTIAALDRLKRSGRKLVLVTGRELDDLKRAFPEHRMFDRVVAENGALVYSPASEDEALLAPPPPAKFVRELEKRAVKPLSVGRSIVATWEPHQATVLDVIKKLNLELEIIFNKGAVMVLPSGINKATGLGAALADLSLSPHNVVGIGDAENDHAFMRACGCSVAVDNALKAVKDTADIVTKGKRGAGVEELVRKLLKHDHDLGIKRRDGVAIGKDGEKDIVIWPTDTVLVAGSSGIGKSTLATALAERFTERKYQFCIIDPEGDYDGLQDAIGIGDGKSSPTKEQVLALLDQIGTNVVVNLLALKVEDRPEFAVELMPEITRLRSKTARPHWLIVDEAHHLLPKKRADMKVLISAEMPGTVLITVDPGALAAEALKLVTVVIGIGPHANDIVAAVAKAAGIAVPKPAKPLKDEQVLFWRRGEDPHAVTAVEPQQSLKRHSRKYAEGTLDERGSFYFTGPEDTMKLRAQNLEIFVQIAEGIDDATWQHHLRAGDYSRWFRTQIRDKKLAKEAAKAEEDKTLSAKESREIILAAVRRRYTAPASGD
ncbi:HAD family hydrolase [Mesorhizobium sp. SP-1A]|uniref:HAD family hydrolase n=1 Tax=Mesorhizobium sp. SP-1A TaxID=3077840 RepID=UPI0028F6D6FC|nr:HAD family hydrolase [Mesorhizobium sp. SP-1A]